MLEGPRGCVRDLRLPWAREEARPAYEVRSASFDGRGPEHFARQPLGQVTFLNGDRVTLFVSGACPLHLACKSNRILPRDRADEEEVLGWTIAALNSIAMVGVSLMVVGRPSGGGRSTAGRLTMPLAQIEGVFESRERVGALASLLLTSSWGTCFAIRKR